MYICNLLSFIFHLLIVFTNSPEAKDLNQQCFQLLLPLGTPRVKWGGTWEAKGRGRQVQGYWAGFWAWVSSLMLILTRALTPHATCTVRWLKLFNGLWTVVDVGPSGRKFWKISVLEGSDHGMMSIASAFWGNGVLELCRQAGSRERAQCSPCQQMDCLIKPLRTSNSSRPGACASFSHRRNHASSLMFCMLSSRGKFPIGF